MKLFSSKRRALNPVFLCLVALLLVACTDLPVSTNPTSPSSPTSTALVSGAPTQQPTSMSQQPTTAAGEPTGTTGSPTDVAQAQPTGTPVSGGSGGRATPSGTPHFDPMTEDCVPGTPLPTEVMAQISPTPTLISANMRRQVFEQVWQTVKQNYLYTDFNGHDWDQMKADYEPKALAAKCSDQYYDLINEMVTDLGDEHSHYESPDQAREEDQLISGSNDYAGIGTLSQPVDNGVLIIYVFRGSPAEAAGLKRRDVIEGINGKPIEDPEHANLFIRGPAGTQVTLTVHSPDQQPRQVTITRAHINGKIYPSISRVGADQSIGFMVLETFDQDDMDTLVEDSLNDLLSDGKPLKGLIIDLRGNGGGLIHVMESILGQFVTGKSGSFVSHGSSFDLVPPEGSLYEQLKDVPLVLLVDKDTVSAAEMFSGALKSRGRAKVVGITSAGNTETIVPYDMPDQSRLWVAEEGFQLIDGSKLEGKGVVPDYEINVDWNTYSEAKDPHILKAIEILGGK